MHALYNSPFRIFVVVAMFVAAGIASALNLSLSLYPEIGKPLYTIMADYEDFTPEVFLREYGERIENKILSNVEVETLKTEYTSQTFWLKVEFRWGVSRDAAKKEIDLIVSLIKSQVPRKVSDSVRYWPDQGTRGSVYIGSIYSQKRSMVETHRIVEPILEPLLERIPELDDSSVYNPNKQSLMIDLDLKKAAIHGLTPGQVYDRLEQAFKGISAGRLRLGKEQMNVLIPPSVAAETAVPDLQSLILNEAGVKLSSVAAIRWARGEGQYAIYRTDGTDSLILWASAEGGANLKSMSDHVEEAIAEAQKRLPPDIEFRPLIDPGEYIENAILHLIIEVILAALIATVVLFLCIGSLRNTITAAIEIPLSLVSAFILMKMSGLNINLLSMGGLALAAGMNVDASVVVMENIFRHMESLPPGQQHDPRLRLNLIVTAVKEVALPVATSTLSTLAVFIPLLMTEHFAAAVLGNLALTIIFSHAFSAVVALILVPTIRLKIAGDPAPTMLMTRMSTGLLSLLQGLYLRMLRPVVRHRMVAITLVLGVIGLFIYSLGWILPDIRREIISLPDSGTLIVSLRPTGQQTMHDMAPDILGYEKEILRKYGRDATFVFTGVRNWNSFFYVRLNNRSELDRVRSELEDLLQDIPDYKVEIKPWSPSELPIPDPPDLEVRVTGGTSAERRELVREAIHTIKGERLYLRVKSDPSVEDYFDLNLRPNDLAVFELQQSDPTFSAEALGQLARMATNPEGEWITDMDHEGQTVDVRLKIVGAKIDTIDDLLALPVRQGEQILSLRSFVSPERRPQGRAIYRDNGEDVSVIEGRLKKDERDKKYAAAAQVQELLSKLPIPESISLFTEDPDKEFLSSINSLKASLIASGLIILVIGLLQFGSLTASLLVFSAVPMGIIGLVFALYLFGSVVSLNSLLGLILLAGISVNNAIIFLDFFRRYRHTFHSLEDAIMDTASKRFRPIFVTSMTTILAMLPIAMGFGEGGKTIQPLGLSVVGGLWVSGILTTFVIPALLTLTHRSGRQSVDSPGGNR